MGYVGTPRSLGSAQATLASIIQGEAGNQGVTGMQAVGAVISNRAASNFSGYGTDPLSQALAPNQFQGQSTSYSPQAYTVAGDVLNGTNPDPTGGATYYANPSASTASWATNLNSSNSLQIGDHYFTDNTQGLPFSGSGSNDYFSNQSAPYSQQAPSVLGASASEDPSGGNLQGTFGLGGPQSTSIDPVTGTSIDQPVNSTPLSNTWDGGLSGIPSAQTSDLPIGSSAGQVAQVGTQGTNVSFAPDSTSSSDPGAGGGGGFPLDITNAPQVGTQAASTISSAASGAANTVGKAVQSGSGQVSSALTNSTQAGIQGLTNLVGSGEQAGTDWLIRFGLIIAAMVLAYGAFVLVSKSDGKFA